MHWALVIVACESLACAVAAHAAGRRDPPSANSQQRRQLRSGLRARQYSNSTTFHSTGIRQTFPSPSPSSAAGVIAVPGPTVQVDDLVLASDPQLAPLAPVALAAADAGPTPPASSGATPAASNNALLAVQPASPAAASGNLPAVQAAAASTHSSKAGFDNLMSTAGDAALDLSVEPPSPAMVDTPVSIQIATPVPIEMQSQITPSPAMPSILMTAGNGSIPSSNTTAAVNATCGACTVNVQAGLRWWFPNVLFHDIASLSTASFSGAESLSVVPITRPYNLSSAMQAGFVTFTFSTYFATALNSTVSDLVMANAPLPTAATTVVFTQADVVKPLATGFIATSQQNKIFPASTSRPSIIAPAATGKVTTATYSTNLLYYTAYEVKRPIQTTDGSGKVVCVTETVTYQMATPYVYNYDDPFMTLGKTLAASGTVLPDFMKKIPQSSCAPGTWIAPEPTMYVLVEETIQRPPQIYAIHHQTTATGGLSAPDLGNPVGLAPTRTTTTEAVVTSRLDDGQLGGSGEVSGIGFAGSSGSTVGKPSSLQPDNGAVAVQNGDKGGAPSSPYVTAAPSIKIGDNIYVANSGGSYIIQGQTLGPGGQIVLSGNTVSLGSSGQSLVVNGVTITRPATLPTGAPPIVVGGVTVAPQTGGGSYIIGGQTLSPGAIITANGNTISLGSGASASVVVVNGQTQSLVPVKASPSITVAGVQYTEQPGASFIIQGQTLRPGNAITVAGTTLSFPGDANALVVNGVTSSLVPRTNPALVIGTTTYPATFGADDVYVLGGQTLKPGGPAITVSGSTISLAPGGSALVVNGATTTLSPTTDYPAAASAAVTDTAIVGSGTRGAAMVATSTTKKAAAGTLRAVDRGMVALLALATTFIFSFA